MRNFMSLVILLVATLLVFCGKDDKGVGPSDSSSPQTKVFRISEHNIFSALPDFVNLMFQVSDSKHKGVDDLAINKFKVVEDNQILDPSQTTMQLSKSIDISYVSRTVLMLDVCSGAKIDALKNAAKEFINKIDSRQMIAIYTFADDVQMVKDFSQNKTELTEAVNSIAERGSLCTLYDAVIKGVSTWQEEYSSDMIKQGQLVVFTDGVDTKGATTLDHALYTGGQRTVFVIGLGSEINADELTQLGNHGYYYAASESELAGKFSEVQDDILKYMNSFYWLQYRSSLRGGTNHIVRLMVSGNINTQDDASIEGYFDSINFVNVNQGLYINWSSGNPKGIKQLNMLINDTKKVHVLSVGGDKTPQYSWTIGNENIAVIESSSPSVRQASLSAVGNDGDQTTLTVKDVANNLEKTVPVKIFTYQIGSILHEWWTGIEGTAISDLTNNKNYPDNPTDRDSLTLFEAPTNLGDNYGTRVRGFLHPATTGSYYFWIASDDLSELRLSSDAKPENATRICYVSTYTNSREWAKEANQKSAAISLEAGKVYYIEALHKEGTGGDNLAVSWQIEGGTQEVIGGEFLSLIILDE